MKKRLLSMLTLICILASLFSMPITVHAASAPTLYVTPGAYPNNTTLSWTNVGASSYDIYWHKYDTNGNYKGEVWIGNTSSTSFSYQITPGYQQFFVNAIFSSSNIKVSNTVSTTVGYQNYYLDINGLLDGTQSGNLSGYGTVDVYINGSRVANDVTDYYTAHPYGSTYSISDIKAATGHSYKGVNSGSTSGTIYGATNVRLSYGTNSYKITVASESTTKGTVSGGGTYVYGKTATIKATPKTGYSFSKWSDGNTSASRTVTVSGDKTYTAYFTANKYTISVSSANTDMGTVSGGGSIAYGTTTTIKATPKTGYSFSKWSDGNTSASRTITVSGNATYKATFVANNYTLYVRPRGGTWNGSTGNQSYTLAYKGTKSIPNPTKTGYTFGAWALDFSGSGHKITGSGTSTELQKVRGTPLFSDPVFNSSNGSMSIYNNKGNGTVTLSRVTKDSAFEMSSSYMMKITTAGEATPGLGGFYQGTTSKSGGIFYHVIAAKIPVGYSIQRASNACGDGATHTWLTPQEGTGKWETYIYKTQCGTSGSFSTFGHVYISGPAATSSKPVTWYVGYAEMFDATNVSQSGNTYTIGSGAGYLQALWIPNRYTIKYNGNGATSGSMINSSHIYDTAKVLTSNTYVRDGYEFLGWSTDSSSSAVAKYTNKQSVINLSSTNGATVNLYAVWKKIPETSGVEFSETSYHGGKKLTLVSGTSGAKIYYTTDGSTPTTSSKVYSEPLDFNSAGTFTVKAFAYKENYITSSVTSCTVSVGTTNPVIYSDESIMTGKTVKITVSNENANIYYTLDGTTPNSESLLYSDVISFNTEGTTTIKAYAVAEGCVPSAVYDHNISVSTVVQPEISVTEEWVGGAMVKIVSSTPSANIYYTIDGTDPLTSSTAKLYSEEFEVDASMMMSGLNRVLIMSAAKKNGYAVSSQTNYLVQIKDRELFAPYSPSIENIVGGKKISLACETEGAEIYYTLDNTEATNSSMLYTEPVELNESTTVRAVAVYDGEQSEEFVKLVEISKMQPPVISVTVGENTSRVQITGQTTNSTIYYTTNGDYPTTQSTQYTSSFEIAEKTTIRAIAVRKGYINSDMAEAEAIVLTITPPTVSTIEAEGITENSAILRGEILSGGGSDVSDMSFIYYERNNRTAVYSVTADSSFSAMVTNLKPNTEYWYQAIVANSKGYANGVVKSFRTSVVSTENPSTVKLSPDFISMSVGTSRTILATILPENAVNKVLIWSSNNENVATVDNNGCITAHEAGDATITAVAPGNKIKGSMKVSVVDGEIKGEFDFSEIAMAKNTSAVWNPSNQGDIYAIDSVMVGGNAVMASAYLARWGGAVLEEKDPYPAGVSGLNTNQYTSDYHVQEILYLPSRQNPIDNDEIKKAIMEYGAVYAQFKLDQNYFTTDLKNYYLPADKASKATGHAIAIVGWDDNYSKLKFKRNNRPEGNGAFICKNSWGTHDSAGYEIGEDGYFYISYYDPYIASYGVNAVFNNAESNSNYNTIYQYDPLGPVLSKEYDNQVYMANVFPRLGEGLAQDESLKAVSFYTADKGMAYEIYVIPEFTTDNFFGSLGVCRASGVMEYAGYHTVKLDSAIDLKAGNRFAVIVKLSSSNGKVETYLEAPIEEMAAQYASAGEGESFISVDGTTWTDIHLEELSNTNACIKAFTNRSESTVSLMSAIDNQSTNDEAVSVYDAIDQGFVVNEEFIEELETVSLFEDEETDSEFGTGASAPSIVVGNNGIDNAEGAKFPSKYDLRKEGYSLSSVKDQGTFNTCWAFATYASLESCIMKNAQKVRYYDNMVGSSTDSAISFASITTPVTAVELNKQEIKIAKGNEEQLYAILTPSNATDKSIVWSSNNTECVQVDTSGNTTAIEIGEATITATNQSSGLSASCVVMVTEPAAVTGITSDITEIVCNEGDLFMIDYEITPENAGNKAVEITFADDIATVSGGLITAVKSGETTITITTVDGGHSITIPLTVLASETSSVTEEVLIEYAEITDTGIAADIINENDNDVIGEIFIATYDKDTKKMINVISEEITVPAGDILPYSTDIEIASNHAVKILIWKKQNIKPLCVAYEIN